MRIGAVRVTGQVPQPTQSLMKALACASLAVTLLAGCASVSYDATQPLRVETETETGRVVAGADCTATNDRGAVAFKSGDTTDIQRSSKDLEIACTSPALPDATGRAVSRANVGMWGNILLGGGVGAVVDHRRGVGYTYPGWLRLVFGKTLEFDRKHEDDGVPLVGRPPPAVER